MVRNYATDTERVGEYLRTTFHEWAKRDAAVLETIQRRLGEDTEPRRDINVKPTVPLSERAASLWRWSTRNPAASR